MDSPVRHDPVRGAFLVEEEGAESVLEYVAGGPGIVSFVHTWVPPARRGRGVAERLVEAGLSWARAEGLKVIASCSYVAAYLGRHPEWADVRAGG